MYKASAKDKYKQNPPKSTAVSNTMEKAAAAPEIDQILVDRTRRPHKQYLRGRFLGKVSISFPPLVYYNTSNYLLRNDCCMRFLRLLYCVLNLFAGWICKMLRTHRHGHEGNICGQNRCKVIASKTPSEGKGIRFTDI